MFTPVKPFLIVICCMAVVAPRASESQAQSLDQILADIGELESDRDPKCYATAARLEGFMYGTPLSDAARFRKNELQTWFVASVWSSAEPDGAELTPDDIDRSIERIIRFETTDNGGQRLTFPSGAQLEVRPVDLRQYGTVAYSLRAILGAQQDALLNATAKPLPPLGEAALARFKERMDLASLALLKEADAYARANDEYEISRDNIERSWLALYREPPDPPEPPDGARVSTGTEKPALLEQIIDEKVAAYARYNDVTNPLFMRNMQVYFARLSWPRGDAEVDAFRDGFISALVAYAADFYNGVVDVALANRHAVIREPDVHRFVEHYTPFEVNEYEDVVYFPNFPDGRVPIEAYDLDAFRDSGVHWLYLGHAIDGDNVTDYLDVDPFAAELIAENVAQMGVLMLREAGFEGKRRGEERLSLALLEAGIANIQAKVEATLAGERLPPASPARIHSAADDAETPTGSEWFTNVTEAAGIDHMHRSSDWLNRQLRSYLRRDETTGIITIPPAFGGSGVAAGDVDNDGDSDLLMLSGLGNRLYRNDGDGGFTDVTEASGLAWVRPSDNQPGEPRQPLVADLDNDGWQDIVITYVDDPHRVYRNRGDGTFEDVTGKAGLGGRGLVGGPATVFDFDNDGLLDIYIQYFGDYLNGALPTLDRFNDNGLPDKLFRNTGGFTFEEVDAGVGDTGWGQSTTHTDIDGDGWQDLISGNDFGTNTYYRNTGEGRFEDITERLGTGKPSYTMNIGLADLNADATPDIYISNIVVMNKDEKYVLPNEDTQMKFNLEKLAHLRVVEANDLFMSSRSADGAVRYTLNRELVGRGYNSTGWSWGASFFDADLDGDDDLYVLNGMNEYNLYSSKNAYALPDQKGRADTYLPVDTRESNVFFINSGGKLNNASRESGLDLLGNSRSAAYLDYDGDGDLDVVLNNYHGPARFYRNNAERLSGNWIKLRLEGDPEQGVNRDAIGARVVFTLEGGTTVWREVHGSEAYMTVHERVIHAGLGGAKRADAQIIWPGGARQTVRGLDANRTHTVAMEEAPAAPIAAGAPH